MLPKYGHMSYELQRAMRLVWDIAENKGLMIGGEQYPNAMNVIESAENLSYSLNRNDVTELSVYSEACQTAISTFAEMLRTVWKDGDLDITISINDIEKIVDEILVLMPQELNRIIK